VLPQSTSRTPSTPPGFRSVCIRRNASTGSRRCCNTWMREDGVKCLRGEACLIDVANLEREVLNRLPIQERMRCLDHAGEGSIPIVSARFHALVLGRT